MRARADTCPAEDMTSRLAAFELNYEGASDVRRAEVTPWQAA